MFGSLLILLVLPYTDLSRIRGNQFKPFMKFAFWFFVVDFIILMWIGSQHPNSPYVEIGQIATAFYFGWFLIIVPVLGVLENTFMDLATENNTQLRINPHNKSHKLWSKNKNIKFPTLRQKFNGFIQFYYKIASLPTGYQIKSNLFLLSLFVITVTSFLIRIDVYAIDEKHPILYQLFLYLSVLYMVFLQFNFGNRLIFVLFKGFPFFKQKILSNYIYIKYFLGYLLFNLCFLAFNILIVYRLYTISYQYFDGKMFDIIFTLNMLASYFLTKWFIKDNWDKTTYEIDHYKINDISVLKTIFLMSVPLTIFINILFLYDYLIIFKPLFVSEPIYCDADGYELISSYYRHRSFWSNILLLDYYEKLGTIDTDFIQHQRTLVVNKLLNTSKYNQIVWESPGIDAYRAPLFKNEHYYKFYEQPVLFNNQYEVAVFDLNSDCLAKVVVSDSESLSFDKFARKILNGSRLTGTIQSLVKDNIISMIRKTTNLDTAGAEVFINGDGYHRIKTLTSQLANNGKIQLRNNYTIIDVFGFNVFYSQITHETFNQYSTIKTFYMYDSFDQLVSITNRETCSLYQSWYDFTNSSLGRKLIKADPNLYSQYRTNRSVVLTYENLKIFLQRFHSNTSYRNEGIFNSSERNVVRGILLDIKSRHQTQMILDNVTRNTSNT